MKKLLVLVVCAFFMTIPSLCLAVNSVEINDTDLNTVKNTIISDMFDMGYIIHSSNDFQVIFKRELNEIMASVFYGSKFNGTPEIRASFNMIQNDKTVRIVLDVKIVTNPGSGFEKYSDNNHSGWVNYLKELKMRFNGGAYFGFDFNSTKKDGGIQVASVYKNSSADEAGLKNGDIILKVNDKKTNYSKLTDLIIAAPEGTTLSLTIKDAAGVERTVTVTKKYVPGITQKKAELTPPSPAPSSTPAP